MPILKTLKSLTSEPLDLRRRTQHGIVPKAAYDIVLKPYDGGHPK